MIATTAVDRGGCPFLFDTKQDVNPSETTSQGRNKYFGQMPDLGIFPVKSRIYQANQTLTLALIVPIVLTRNYRKYLRVSTIDTVVLHLECIFPI